MFINYSRYDDEIVKSENEVDEDLNKYILNIFFFKMIYLY